MRVQCLREGILQPWQRQRREKCAALHCLNPCGAQRSAGLMGWAQETREVPAPTGDAETSRTGDGPRPKKKKPEDGTDPGQIQPSGPNDGANQCVIWRNRPPGGVWEVGSIRIRQSGTGDDGVWCFGPEIRRKGWIFVGSLRFPGFCVSGAKMSTTLEISGRAMTGWVCVKKRERWSGFM